MRRMLTGLGIVWALAGCDGAPATGPAPIVYGEDACAACRMIVSEAPHAAQARLPGGIVESYDDIGCLVTRVAEGAAPVETWVVDRPTGAWIDARTARFVQTEKVRTPMASGLVAYGDASAAAAFAAETGGRALDWDAVLGSRRPKAPAPR